MSSKIRDCVKNLGKNKNPEKLLPEYVEQYMQLNSSYAEIQFMMEYYMFYETVSEGTNPYIDLAEEIAGELHKMVEIFYNQEPSEEQVQGMAQELLKFRQDVINRMQVLTAYIDCFIVYEYILNRVQYRFDDREMMPEDSVFAQSLVEFIFSGEDNMIVNDYIRMAIGQLPMRMARSRYFEWIRNSVSVCIGGDKSSLDSFLYMFRMNAMLYRNEYMEEYFTEFASVIEEMAALDYENIDWDTYSIYADKILANASKLNDLSDLYMQLGQLINEAYCIFASAKYTEKKNESDAEKIVIKGINSLFLSKDSDVWNYSKEALETEEEKLYWLEDQLEKIEGRQERIYTSINMAGAALEEIAESHKERIVSLGLSEDFAMLKKMVLLSSGSTFADLESQDEEEKVTEKMAEEAANELIAECKSLFQGKSRMVRRAIMVNTLGSMPLFFTSPQEVSDYVMNSLQQCDDEAEKYAAKQLLLDIMQ